VVAVAQELLVAAVEQVDLGLGLDLP